MADLNLEGNAPQAVPTEDTKAEHQHRVTMKPLGEETQEQKNLFQVRPTTHVEGNELIAIIRMLEGINRNLAFLATTVHKHLNPEKK